MWFKFDTDFIDSPNIIVLKVNFFKCISVLSVSENAPYLKVIHFYIKILVKPLITFITKHLLIHKFSTSAFIYPYPFYNTQDLKCVKVLCVYLKMLSNEQKKP